MTFFLQHQISFLHANDEHLCWWIYVFIQSSIVEQCEMAFLCVSFKFSHLNIDPKQIGVFVQSSATMNTTRRTKGWIPLKISRAFVWRKLENFQILFSRALWWTISWIAFELCRFQFHVCWKLQHNFCNCLRRSSTSNWVWAFDFYRKTFQLIKCICEQRMRLKRKI